MGLAIVSTLFVISLLRAHQRMILDSVSSDSSSWVPSVSQYPNDNIRIQDSSHLTTTMFIDTASHVTSYTTTLQQHPQQKDNNQTLSTMVSLTSPFAFVYVIGGCDPSRPSYRGYLYNILISTYIQHQHGSTADTVVYIQMIHSIDAETLPERDVRPLRQLGIHIRYIPKNHDESFHRIILQKFIVLNLTEYSRVIFLDGDVTLRNNIDYLFDWSIRGLLKENVILRGITEPANAGLFMLSPGGYDTIQSIIYDTEERGREMMYPYWDETVGWGSIISTSDPWISLTDTTGTKWNFYGAYTDQGLLYHWVKYVQRSFSVATRDRIEHWGPMGNGTRLEGVTPLTDWAHFTNVTRCYKGTNKFRKCLPPHSDMIHYTGTHKPWMQPIPKGLNRHTRSKSQYHFWFGMLMELNDTLQLDIDFQNWTALEGPLLGLFPDVPTPF
jgi:hypothetical protein